MQRIRVRSVAARLMLGCLFLLFIALATRPLIHITIDRCLRGTLGTQVQVGHMQASLRESRVDLQSFTASDPHHAGRLLFRAAELQLELDRASFLRRKIVVNRGRVSGLELIADRDAVPAIDTRAAATYQAALVHRFDKIGSRWFGQAADELAVDVTEDLKSIAMARELLERWPGEYTAIERNAHELKSRILALRELLNSTTDNPLRNLEAYQQAVQELEGLGREIFEVRRQVEQICQQIAMDRDQLASAQQADLEGLAQRHHLSPLDDQTLSEYLLSVQVADRLNTVLRWVQLSRRYTPTLSARHAAMSARGQDHVFVGQQPQPDVLVKTLVFQGQGLFGTEPVALEGTIRNLSSQPAMLDVPIEVAMQTTGERPMMVQARLDATGAEQVDQVIIDCPRLAQERVLLGNPDQLAIVLGAGDVHLWARVEIAGDAVKGEIRMKQTGLSLTPQLHPRLGTTEISQVLDRELDQVRSLDVAVEIGGSLASPSWQLRSNLGPQVATGMKAALETEMLARRERQLRQAHEVFDEKARLIEAELLARQQAILEVLQFGNHAIDEVRQDIATRMNEASTRVPLR